VSRDLLLEIGVEEVPSAPLYDAVTQLKTRAAAALDGARLSYGEITGCGSPRRLALMVTGLAERQGDLSMKVKGPAVAAAFDSDGNPTKAAEGFARSRGLAVSDLVRESTDGGEYVFALVEEEGKPAEEILPGLLAQLIGDLDWAKSMRWGSGSVRFIRPVRWLVALFGSIVVPVRFAGVEAGRTTFGHRSLRRPPRDYPVSRARISRRSARCAWSPTVRSVPSSSGPRSMRPQVRSMRVLSCPRRRSPRS